MSKNLSAGHKHLIRLIARDKDAEGWTPVSKMVWPLVEELSKDLVELRPSDNGGHAKLTPLCCDLAPYIL